MQLLWRPEAGKSNIESSIPRCRLHTSCSPRMPVAVHKGKCPTHVSRESSQQVAVPTHAPQCSPHRRWFDQTQGTPAEKSVAHRTGPNRSKYSRKHTRLAATAQQPGIHAGCLALYSAPASPLPTTLCDSHQPTYLPRHQWLQNHGVIA